MNKFRPALIALALLGMQCAAWAGGIAVNEYYNGNANSYGSTKMSGNEFIEFAITERMTASDLAGLTFGDSNSSNTMLQGVFNFDQTTLNSVLSNAGLTAFLPGTMIVVKGAGLGAQNLSYNPLASNISNSDAWSIELVAGQGAVDNAERRINGNIGISTTGDVVWISSSAPPVNNTDTTGFISAIGHGATTGAIAKAAIADFGSSSILPGSVNSGNSVANIGNGTISLEQTSSATMGQANSTTNGSWITSLRTAAIASVPEPSRHLLMMSGLAAAMLRRKRPAPLS